MKQRDIFNNPLKEKLNEYRAHLLSLDEIINFLDVYYKKKNRTKKKPFVKECNEFTTTYQKLLKKLL
tara:strand:+ start:483 stop:683 length:201 start_codon:yes stop_codon:yes gene_type:complete